MITKWNLTKDLMGIIFFASFMIFCIWFFTFDVSYNIMFQFLVFIVSLAGIIVSFLAAVGYCGMFKDDWEKYRFVEDYR